MSKKMRAFIFAIVCLLLLHACAPTAPQTANEPQPIVDKIDSIQVPDFQAMLDSSKLKGTILIWHPASKKYYSNNFEQAQQGHLPASTFKIVNTLIGLETGVVDTNSIFKWDGKKRRLPSWEKDLNLHDAFHASCVPCYQELARKIGLLRMQDYLKKFDYGQIQFDSSSLDLFWLEGPSRISPYQQIAFLEKLYKEELPAKASNMQTLKALMQIEDTGEYQLHGKTGWAMRNDFNLGWFVGYIHTKGDVYYVATAVEPTAGFNMDDFGKIRLQLSMQAWRQIAQKNKSEK